MAYIYQADIYCDDCGTKIINESTSEILDDSDEFPQYCDNEQESDCPEHCACQEECINAIELSDGTKIGCLIGTNLTNDGIEYVKEAVKDGGLVAELWKQEFNYIDFD